MHHFGEFVVVLQDLVELSHRVGAELVAKVGHFSSRVASCVSVPVSRPLAVRSVTAERAALTGSSAARRRARRCLHGPSEVSPSHIQNCPERKLEIILMKIIFEQRTVCFDLFETNPFYFRKK